jgi:hypothetical protein
MLSLCGLLKGNDVVSPRRKKASCFALSPRAKFWDFVPKFWDFTPKAAELPKIDMHFSRDALLRECKVGGGWGRGPAQARDPKTCSRTS